MLQILLGWIRIRIFKLLDPDPHWEEQRDPDPQKMNTDQQPWFGSGSRILLQFRSRSEPFCKIRLSILKKTFLKTNLFVWKKYFLNFTKIKASEESPELRRWIFASQLRVSFLYTEYLYCTYGSGSTKLLNTNPIWNKSCINIFIKFVETLYSKISGSNLYILILRVLLEELNCRNY